MRSLQSLFKKSQGNFSIKLKSRLKEIVPSKVEELKEIKRLYGSKVVGEYKVDQVLGGMRSIKGLFYDTSILDPMSGITFRGQTIPDLLGQLPKAIPEGEPLPEGLFYLLMTGELPSEEDAKDIKDAWIEKGQLSTEVVNFIKNLPREMHPMTMLSMSLLYLQQDSVFHKLYSEGKLNQSVYWEYYYDDAMILLAKIPRIAALIYRHQYSESKFIEADPKLDWAGNYSHMMGFPEKAITECIRGYLTIHSDHEGGNVSAHATHLVGSALADPYLSYSAGINGLAGPLHGLANQEVLKWLLELQEKRGNNPSKQDIVDYVHELILNGQVVPGYGHAVLRHTDPRFLHQKDFAAKYIPNEPLIQLVKHCYEVVPSELKKYAKIQNPWPNVDAHSGSLLYSLGLKEFDYYTVVFAVSRALGVMANNIWARAYGLPIERPGSVDVKWIKEKFGPKQGE